MTLSPSSELFQMLHFLTGLFPDSVSLPFPAASDLVWQDGRLSHGPGSAPAGAGRAGRLCQLPQGGRASRAAADRARPGGHSPAATRASRKPRSQPSASSSSTASRNSAAAAVTPFSSSFRTLSFTSREKPAEDRQWGHREGPGAAGAGAAPLPALTVGQPFRHVAEDVHGVQAPLDVAPVALQVPLLLRRHGQAAYAPPPPAEPIPVPRSRCRDPGCVRGARRNRGTERAGWIGSEPPPSRERQEEETSVQQKNGNWKQSGRGALVSSCVCL